MFRPRPFAAAALRATVLAGAALTALPAQATEAAPFPELPTRPSGPPATPPAAPRDQFIVGLKSRGGIAAVAASISQVARQAVGALGIGAEYLRPTAAGSQIVKTSNPLRAAFLAALRSSPDVAYAEPDVVLHAAVTPNGPGYLYQWPPLGRHRRHSCPRHLKPQPR